MNERTSRPHAVEHDAASSRHDTHDQTGHDVDDVDSSAWAPMQRHALAQAVVRDRRSELDRLRRMFGLPVDAATTASDSTTGSEVAPVDVPHRADMEKRFNRSFSNVVVYTGRRDLLDELGARAATRGNVVVFADESPDAAVVAHELTHVVQQRGGAAPASAEPAIAPKSTAAEVEADANAAVVAAGEDSEQSPVALEGRAAPTEAIHLDRGGTRPANKIKTPVGLPEPLPPETLPPAADENRVDGEGNTIELHNGHWHLVGPPKAPAFTAKAGYKPALLPINPNASYHALLARVQALRLEQLAIAESLRGDMKYWFAKVYFRVTTRELEFIAGGKYQYPHMKLQEVIAFHTTYKTNLDAWQAGNKAKVEAQWREAFSAAESEQGGTWYKFRSHEILSALLPSMQAHIRIDLPRAIAACFVTHYAGIPGTGLADFRPDFDAMGPVFDLATEDMRGEIGDDAAAVDPGSWGWTQDAGFPFIFNVPRERNMAWEKSNVIADAMQDGSTNRDVRGQLYADQVGRHPNSDPFDVDGTSVLKEVDWLNQPGMTQDRAAPGPTYEAASQPPTMPPKLFFKLDRPRNDSEKLEDAIRSDQDLAAFVELAQWTRTVRGAHIHVIAQASDEGTDEHNKELSARRSFLFEYFMFKCGADMTNNTLTVENRGEGGASKGPDYRFVQVLIPTIGTGRQQHHTPNTNLPSEVSK
jgi:hypothetical protein